MLQAVLVVEDDPCDLELILIALQRSQLANPVVAVSDGELALDYLHCAGAYAGREGGHPVVILLDLKLPKVNGLEVLKHVRSSAGLGAIPVVLLTSSQEAADVRLGKALGVDAYVVKPIALKHFMAAIDGLGVLWAAAQRLGAGAAPPVASGG